MLYRHNRRRIGPRYSCSFDNTLPFCITSILFSFTKLLAATLVGCIRLLQSTPEGSSPRFESARGISLGQHVLPGALLMSSCIISFFSISSVISSVCFDAASLFVLFDVFLFFFVQALATSSFMKCSFMIFIPSDSNLIPSSSNIRFFS